MPTDFPRKGDDKKVVLRNSNYPQFDYEFALDLRENYPSIWNKGGMIRGTSAFTNWGKARQGDYTEAVEDWVKEREAWAARHLKDFRLAGVVAQIKWGVIGSRGEAYMKNLVNEQKEKANAMQKIVFEQQVDSYSCDTLMQQIDAAGDADISLEISSLGGSVLDALKTYKKIKDRKGKTTVTMYSFTASAATIIALAADEVRIDEYGFMLIHDARAGVAKYEMMPPSDIDDFIEELEKTNEFLGKVSSVIASIYAKKTGRSIDEIREKMQRDEWMTASEALEYGLVDSIVEYDNANAQARIAQAVTAMVSMPKAIQDTSVVKDNLTTEINETNTESLISQTENTTTMLDKVKAFFSKLGIKNADEKASEFVATFNDDIKNAINEVSAEIISKEGEAAKEVKAIVDSKNSEFEAQNKALVEQLSNMQVSIDAIKNELSEQVVAAQSKIEQLESKLADAGTLKLKAATKVEPSNGDAPIDATMSKIEKVKASLEQAGYKVSF